MNKKLYIMISKLFPIMILGLLVISCQKEEELQPMRMFTPAGVIKSTSGEKQVKLTWNPSLYSKDSDGVSYTVEVAEDTLFQTPIVVTAQTDTAGVTFTDEQLRVKKYYYARIKANKLGEREESKWMVSNRFWIKGEMIFESMGDSELIHNSAYLRWKERRDLTVIVLTQLNPSGVAPIEITLSDNELAERKLLLEGLTPESTYMAEIFQGEKPMGTIIFTTKRPIEGSNVIDLTSFTDRPSVLQDTLPHIGPGSLVVLKRGVTYNISSTVHLDKSIKIMSEHSFSPQLAIINLSSNFNLVNGSNIESVVFEGISFNGSFASNYVFNINTGGTIGEIKFENCRIRSLRGVTRFQGTGIGTIDKFSIINSVVDSVRDFGVFNVDAVGWTAKDILIKNSTFTRVQYFLVSRTNTNSVNVENCTFNLAPEGGRAIFRWRGAAGSDNVTGGITISNSIFGPGWDMLLSGNTAVSGFEGLTGTAFMVSNSYLTSDFAFSRNEIMGLTKYTKTAEDLWVAPFTDMNFRYKDSTFPGAENVGDPRWR